MVLVQDKQAAVATSPVASSAGANAAAATAATTTIDDLDLPKSTVARVLKQALPDGTPVQKDARTALAKAGTVFVSYITDMARELAADANRKTVGGAEVMRALAAVGLEELVPAVEELVAGVNQARRGKGQAKTGDVDEAGDEDDDGATPRTDNQTAQDGEDDDDALARDEQDDDDALARDEQDDDNALAQNEQDDDDALAQDKDTIAAPSLKRKTVVADTTSGHATGEEHADGHVHDAVGAPSKRVKAVASDE